MEYRVARSAPANQIVNTLDLRRPLTFAILEFLDKSDSLYFAKKLKAKKWKNITPKGILSTYYNKSPKKGEIETLKDVSPDWMYLSGHYGRTLAPAEEGRILTIFPGGFFNEPFHQKEWVSAWSKTDNRSFFLQCEDKSNKLADEFIEYLKKRTIRKVKTFRFDDERPIKEVGSEWCEVWKSPTKDVSISNQVSSGSRGFLLDNKWPDVKILITICCNLLAWKKNAIRKAYPNALILGYIGKNPANAKPHVRAFLQNVFRGISDPGDPALVDHDHVAKAWMDVHYKQRSSKSERLAYLTTANDLMAIGPKNPRRIGKHDEVTISPSLVSPEVFGYYIESKKMVLEP